MSTTKDIEFQDFIKIESSIELLDHLENLGFGLCMYGLEAYWHFEEGELFSSDALKYYKDEGIMCFSGPESMVSVNGGSVNSILEANQMYYCFIDSLKREVGEHD